MNKKLRKKTIRILKEKEKDLIHLLETPSTVNDIDQYQKVLAALSATDAYLSILEEKKK